LHYQPLGIEKSCESYRDEGIRRYHYREDEEDTGLHKTVLAHSLAESGPHEIMWSDRRHSVKKVLPSTLVIPTIVPTPLLVAQLIS
jgi:hypothetical protein